MKPTLSTILLLAFATPALAESGDDTLRYYLSKSELVVAGELLATPSGVVSDLGTVHYNIRMRVSDVLKGNTSRKSPFSAKAVRLEWGSTDRLPFFKKGGKCILFLKRVKSGTTTYWKAVDPWFGVQPANSVMERELKRLAKEKKRK